MIELEIASGVNEEGKAFCEIRIDGEPVGQLSPDEVRQLASGWFGAAEAAETDSLILRVLEEEIGMEREAAAVFIMKMREYRDGIGYQEAEGVIE